MNAVARFKQIPLALATLSSAVLLATTAYAAELTGFALMPANTFAEGPTSGQFAGAGAGGNPLPLANKQPVQGVSSVLRGPNGRSFYVMSDNGFGAKNNSADALNYAWTAAAISGSATNSARSWSKPTAAAEY